MYESIYSSAKGALYPPRYVSIHNRAGKSYDPSEELSVIIKGHLIFFPYEGMRMTI